MALSTNKGVGALEKPKIRTFRVGVREREKKKEREPREIKSPELTVIMKAMCVECED